MTRSLTAQAVAVVLSALATLGTLMALDGLAHTEQAAPQQVAAAEPARA